MNVMVIGRTNASADAKKLWTKIRLETYSIIEAAADEVMQFVEELKYGLWFMVYVYGTRTSAHPHIRTSDENVESSNVSLIYI